MFKPDLTQISFELNQEPIVEKKVENKILKEEPIQYKNEIIDAEN